MVTAGGADVGAALLQLVEGALDGTALGAIETGSAETNLHDVLQGRHLPQGSAGKLTNREVRRCGWALVHATRG